MKASEVFGVQASVNDYSYVDRGNLDEEIRRLAERETHVSLKGESKAGKSWLRQKVFPDAIVVQCRLGFAATDVYKSILASLDIKLDISHNKKHGGMLEFSGSGEAGWKLLAKVVGSAKLSGSLESGTQRHPVGKDLNDLEFICGIIRESGRRVVIEDFHYLSNEAQRSLAHDLKAFWDYRTFVVIIDVWVRRNYLTHLNPDLAGRITEVSVYWSATDLVAVIQKGSNNLNIDIDHEISSKIVRDSYGNVGLLQALVLETLDQSDIFEGKPDKQFCTRIDAYESAAMNYAEQLEAVYLEFSRRVSSGIRNRQRSTNIYAHAMIACFESSDDELVKGVPFQTIYYRAHERQPRVQQGNLKSILRNIDRLQIDDRGKGLVLTYVEQSNAVAVVDRAVLFYRKYATVNWPWQEIIDELGDEALEGEA